MYLILHCGKAYYSATKPESEYVRADKAFCEVCPYATKLPIKDNLNQTALVRCCKIKKILNSGGK